MSTPRPKPQPVLRQAVRRFLVGGVVTLAVLAGGTIWVARVLADDIALHEAAVRGQAFATGVAGPLVNADVRRRDPKATEALAYVMRSRMRDGSIVHIKIWSPQGEVIWSDEQNLIGRTFTIEPADRELFGTTRATAKLSDLQKVENAGERGQGQLLEVYAGTHDTMGNPMLFESYWSTDRIQADQIAITSRFTILILGALLLFLLAIMPLALTLARRVDRAQIDRNKLLRHALSAADLERRRMSQDLHDGLIQDLSGLAYALPVVTQQLPAEATSARAILTEVDAGLRRDISALRAMLTDLYPAELKEGGLAGAVEQLAGQARGSGLRVKTVVDLGEQAAPPNPRVSQLAYRVVREGLRNVVRHAQATQASVSVLGEGPDVIVTVTDNGRGPERTDSPDGHLGLRLLRDTLTDIGGQLTLERRPEGGARLTAQFPADFAERLDL